MTSPLTYTSVPLQAKGLVFATLLLPVARLRAAQVVVV